MTGNSNNNVIHYRVILILLKFLFVFIVIVNPVRFVLAQNTAGESGESGVLITTDPVPQIKYSKLKPVQKTSITTESATTQSADAISKAELEIISKRFVAAIVENNPEKFSACLDQQAMIQKSILGSIQKLGDLDIVREKIRRGIVLIPDLLTTKMGTRGSIKFLRVIKRQFAYRGLVRIKFSKGELSYLELTAKKDKNGDIKIVDFDDAMLGRSYTTIVSQLLITPLTRQLDTDKILYFQNQALSFQQRYAKTIRFYISGEYQQAIKSFQQLPTKFKVSRDMLLLRIQIAKATNKNAYREALMLLNMKYPDAPELALLLSDHYYFSKQYPRGLQLITEFSDYIGGDVALDNLKVKLHIQLKHYKQAIVVGKRALTKDGSYQDLYWLMLKAYLNTYQYQQVGEILDVLLDRFNANIALDTFYKEPFYREYGYSKQFKKWKAARLSSASESQ